MIIVLLCALLITGLLIYLAIKAFKYSFDDDNGCLLRVLAFIVACWIISSIFGD